MSPTAHLVIAPILLPLLAAIAMLVLGSRRIALQRAQERRHVGPAICRLGREPAQEHAPDPARHRRALFIQRSKAN